MSSRSHNSKTQVLYTLGLGHSGSTVMDMTLGSLNQVVGLGEVKMLLDNRYNQKYIRNKHSEICSCGKSISKCELWSLVLERIKEKPEESYLSRYHFLISIIARKEIGAVLSDSSKSLSSLKELTAELNSMENSNIEFHVIHLIKELPLWLTSQKKVLNLSRWDILPLLRLSYYWLRENLEMMQFLKKSRTRYTRVRYKAFCQNPVEALGDVINANELIWPDQFRLNPSKNHIGLGNEMRTNSSKTKEIKLDLSYKKEPLIRIISFMLIPFRLFLSWYR